MEIIVLFKTQDLRYNIKKPAYLVDRCLDQDSMAHTAPKK